MTLVVHTQGFQDYDSSYSKGKGKILEYLERIL